MNKLFWLIYIQPLHRIMIFMILAAVLWGYLGNREQGSRRWRILNAAVFAGIAAVIFYMTVCARGEETAEAVLVPFQNFREAREQPELYRSMLMNVLLFFPTKKGTESIHAHRRYLQNPEEHKERTRAKLCLVRSFYFPFSQSKIASFSMVR